MSVIGRFMARPDRVGIECDIQMVEDRTKVEDRARFMNLGLVERLSRVVAHHGHNLSVIAAQVGPVLQSFDKIGQRARVKGCLQGKHSGRNDVFGIGMAPENG